MTARAAYDLYDLNSPFVPPTAPTTTPPAITTARAPYLVRVARMRLFQFSARTGLFAVLLLLLGQVLIVTWIGQVTGEDNMLLWLSVIAGGNIFAGTLTLLAVRAGMFGGVTA